MALDFSGFKTPDFKQIGGFLKKAMKNNQATAPHEMDYIDTVTGDIDYDAYNADLANYQAPQAQAPKAQPSAQANVLAQFGGDMQQYNQWWHNLPESERPTNWGQAERVLSKQGAGGEPTTLLKEASTPSGIEEFKPQKINAGAMGQTAKQMIVDPTVAGGRSIAHILDPSVPEGGDGLDAYRVANQSLPNFTAIGKTAQSMFIDPFINAGQSIADYVNPVNPETRHIAPDERGGGYVDYRGRGAQSSPLSEAYKNEANAISIQRNILNQEAPIASTPARNENGFMMSDFSGMSAGFTPPAQPERVAIAAEGGPARTPSNITRTDRTSHLGTAMQREQFKDIMSRGMENFTSSERRFLAGLPFEVRDALMKEYQDGGMR